MICEGTDRRTDTGDGSTHIAGDRIFSEKTVLRHGRFTFPWYDSGRIMGCVCAASADCRTLSVEEVLYAPTEECYQGVRLCHVSRASTPRGQYRVPGKRVRFDTGTVRVRQNDPAQYHRRVGSLHGRRSDHKRKINQGFSRPRLGHLP